MNWHRYICWCNLITTEINDWSLAYRRHQVILFAPLTFIVHLNNHSIWNADSVINHLPLSLSHFSCYLTISSFIYFFSAFVSIAIKNSSMVFISTFERNEIRAEWCEYVQCMDTWRMATWSLYLLIYVPKSISEKKCG